MKAFHTFDLKTQGITMKIAFQEAAPPLGTQFLQGIIMKIAFQEAAPPLGTQFSQGITLTIAQNINFIA